MSSFLDGNDPEPDEEVRREHQEQNCTLEHIGKAGVHLGEGGSRHGGAVVQHADQRGYQEDSHGIQLAEPGHDDTGPAHIVGDGGGQDSGGAYLEGGCQTDEGGGQEHGAQHNGRFACRSRGDYR